jgi:hypothetical protein
VLGCAASVCFAAPDSLSQAQAREALREKIAELNEQGTAAVTPVPKSPSAKKKTTPAPKPQPVAQQPSATITPAPAPAAPSPAAVVTAPPSTTPMVRSSSEELARQREAVRQKIAELYAQENAGQPTPVVKSLDTKSADVKWEQSAAAGVKSATFAPLPTAPSALSGSKEARLSELLNKYRADAISPEEYHKERAKILAEP